jgi:prolyl oligopeptidase
VIVDEHRWLECLDSAATRRWLTVQARRARLHLDELPERRGLLERIQALTDSVQKVTGIQRAGDRYFYYGVSPGENDRSIYTQRGLKGRPRLLVPGDGGLSSAQHTSITSFRPSPDGRVVAYVTVRGGSDVGEMRFMDADTRCVLPDRIDGVRFGVGEWVDGARIVCTRVGDGNGINDRAQFESCTVYMHRLGTPVATDRIVFGRGSDSADLFGDTDIPTVSLAPGAQYVIGEIDSGVSATSRFYVKRVRDLTGTRGDWTVLARAEDRVTAVVTYRDSAYLLARPEGAPPRVARTSLRKPWGRRTSIVFNHPTQVVKGLAVARDALYLVTVEEGRHGVWRVPHTSAVAEPVMPPHDRGMSICGVTPRRAGILVAVTSWLTPTTIVKYDAAGRRTIRTRLSSRAGHDASGMHVVRTTVAAADGAEVPLTIIGNARVPKDGRNPTLLTAYGAYGVLATEPFFRPSSIAWLERGGLLAIAGVRGGGEKGDAWHAAGMKAKKRNGWNDFIACAEYLVADAYTAPGHLGAHGLSAGSIVVGRAMIERPHLFGAVVLSSGLNNVLRAETTANGRANVEEFGRITTREGFGALRAMDVYQNIRAGVRYPPVLLTAGANDSRVPLWMSAKTAAKLQQSAATRRQTLLRIDGDGGHVMAHSKIHDDALNADIYAFLLQYIGRRTAAKRA